MKKYLFLSLSFYLCLIGCRKEYSVIENDSTVNVEVNLFTEATKSGMEYDLHTFPLNYTPALAPDLLESCRLYVFDLAGKPVISLDATSGRCVLSLEKGEYEFIAVANAGELQDVSSPEALLSGKFRISEDSGSVPMVGRQSQAVDDFTKVNIELKRSVASISVSVAFSPKKTEYTSFRIESLGFINVPAELDIDAVFNGNGSVAGEWFNKGSDVNSTSPYVLSVNQEIPAGSSLMLTSGKFSSSFLLFPNYCTEDSYDKVWTPRKTRFFIKGVISSNDTEHIYYPLDIPVLKPGSQYNLSVTVTGKGVSDPDTEWKPWVDENGEGGDSNWGEGGDVDFEL